MEDYMELILDRLRSIETQMATDRANAEESRRRLYEKINEANIRMEKLDMRVTQMEKKFDEISPTIKEFSTIKTQALGAGKLGKFLWWLGGIIVGIALWLVTFWDSIVKLLVRLITPSP